MDPTIVKTETTATSLDAGEMGGLKPLTRGRFRALSSSVIGDADLLSIVLSRLPVRDLHAPGARPPPLFRCSLMEQTAHRKKKQLLQRSGPDGSKAWPDFE